MIEKFLKAKHWQLFILILGIPVLFQVGMMIMMFSNFSVGTEPDPAMMFNYMKFFPIMMLVFAGGLFGWFWSVAIGLQRKVPEGINMKVKKFKLFFFIPLVYILLFMGFFAITITRGDFSPLIFAVIVPLHLFSMFCIFYTLYFVAKTFKTVQLQREVTFSDFGGEFFMIWFYPVGIWIMQPKINKMIAEESVHYS